MDILHISDLHLTQQSDQFDLHTEWLAAGRGLGDQLFDFIVISGDLTQTASHDNYPDLNTFISERLLLRLKEGARDKKRVIIVPGNHDVNWDVCEKGFKEVEITANPDIWSRAYEKVLKQLGGGTNYRIEIGDKGVFKIFEIDRDKYHERFRAFQSFYNSFYGPVLSGPKDKAMNLLAAERAGDDFSMHVFEAEKVAFLGLNSCSGNDKLWRGAAFNRHAIQRGSLATSGLGKEFTIIGVWHHGLMSEKGQPDYLDLAELREVQNAGCHIGLHGHTHQDEEKELQQFQSNFVVLGAGSLTAGENHRPGSVGRQFETLKVGSTSGSRVVYEFDPKKGHFVSSKPKKFYFSSAAVLGNQTDRPDVEVEKNVRHVKVSSNGVAVVRTTLEKVSVRQDAPLPLATIIPPFGAAAVGKRVSVDGFNYDIHAQELLNNAHYFTTRNPVRQGEYDLIAWEYRISNRIALNAFELSLREGRHTYNAVLNSDEEILGHIVSFKCMRLELTLELPRCKICDPATSCISGLKCIAERPLIRGGCVEWIVENGNSKKIEPLLTIEEETIKLELIVPKPTVGHRYSMLYKPCKREQKRDPDTTHLLRLARTICRQKNGTRLVSKLRSNIITMISSIVDGNKNIGRILKSSTYSEDKTIPGVNCLGFLWSESSKRLEVCFGDVTPDRWGKIFPYGVGLAGHSFKVCEIIAFHRDATPGNVSSIYIEDPAYEHEWLICIPIFTSNENPVGVVCFSRRSVGENLKKVGNALASHARTVCEDYDRLIQAVKDRNRKDIDPQFHEVCDFHQNLRTAVCQGFWGSFTSQESELDDRAIKYATKNTDAFADAQNRLSIS